MFNRLFLTGVGFPFNILNDLTLLLDRAVYSLVQIAYKVFTYLANASILDDTIVRNVTTRVYTLLGILMVFVLAFNLLTYIVDPDKINDKKVGASTFIKDVIIALAVISITPMLFTKLYSLQSTIITSGVIENLVLGGNPSSDAPSKEIYEANKDKYRSLTDYYIQNGANNMVASVYVAFLYPNQDLYSFTALDCTPSSNEDNKTEQQQQEEAKFEKYCQAYEAVKSGYSITKFSQFINDDDYSYTPFITTVAGIVLLFFMFSFCINLAKRVGKLAIIQLIAPIPMTLELLPNKKGLRENWFKTLLKVYAESFLYLLVMYLIIFLISLVPRTVAKIFEFATIDGLSLVKLLSTVFLIYGLLKFGKEAPQLIFDLLGIKTTGVIAEAAKRALALPRVMAGAAGTFGGATIGNFARNFNATDGNPAQKILSGLGGAGSSFVRNAVGLRNVHSAKDLAALRKNTNQAVVTKRVNRDAYAHAHGGTLGGVMAGHAKDLRRDINLSTRSYLGADNKYQEKRNTESVLKSYKQLYEENVESLWKSDSQWSSADADAKKWKAVIKANGGNGSIIDQVTGKSYSDLLHEAETIRDNRRNDLLNIKKIQFMEAAGKLNNFIDANQGIEGVTENRLDLESIGRIQSAQDAERILRQMSIEVTGKTLEGKDVAEGFATILDDLKKDTPYQTERVQDKLREDAKKATQEAAEKANNKNDNKK